MIPVGAVLAVYGVVPFLSAHRLYVSFLTALHLHGMTDQIPQVVEAATTATRRRIATPVGVFELHRIGAPLFAGFDWYGDRHDCLIAEPEKALFDCVYLSTRRGRCYLHLPEIEIPRGFRRGACTAWANKVGDPRIRALVLERLARWLG